MAENCIQKAGPGGDDFLQRFIDTMKEKTGLDMQNYDFTDEFNQTLQKIGNLRMPYEFFDAIIYVAIRLITLGMDDFDLISFVNSVMKALTAFWEWFHKRFTSKIFYLLLALCPTPLMKIVIGVIYFLVDNYGMSLWNEYIGPRVRGYVEFTVKKIRERIEPSSTDKHD
ncbi:uncharacterized protein [Fopius arisanus]|uniref:Uncharacterized protein n=1 Tax=Fopius arisanus TaxID=64838 RepID=A0A9R1TMF7_9HYME|nr:PREDICTED: uncharacterized protein LOC105272008 [Fopius arisanus]